MRRIIMTALLAVAAVVTSLVAVAPVQAQLPDTQLPVVRTATRYVETGVTGVTADPCCTPLYPQRFLYNRACIQNETGWTTYDGAQDVAASRYSDARDFGPLVSLMLPQTCGSFAGTPSYLTMKLQREWAANGTCWRISGAQRSEDSLGTWVWSGQVTITMNTYYVECGISPFNSVKAAGNVSQAMGFVLGCDQFHGGVTTGSAHPISYTVMNLDRNDIAYPTQLDTSATSNGACLNRRY